MQKVAKIIPFIGGGLIGVVESSGGYTKRATIMSERYLYLERFKDAEGLILGLKEVFELRRNVALSPLAVE
jgi:hypothetical protein